MIIFRDLKEVHVSSPTVLTLGNFDGLHLGHQSLIRFSLALAQAEKLQSGLLTFFPHPVQILYPERKLKRLFPVEDLAEQLERTTMDFLVIQPFDIVFSKIKAEDFLNFHILKSLQPKHVVVGHDFAFGQGRTGSLEVLEKWGRDHGCQIHRMTPIQVENETCSSSLLRRLLAEGHVHEMLSRLGRYFYVQGDVVQGAQRGRKLGFPTANLSVRGETLPKSGVYCGVVEIQEKFHPAVANLGTNPTFQNDPNAVSLECHLLGYSGDLYGKQLRFHFMERLRDERKFESIEALKNQIECDVQEAKKILSGQWEKAVSSVKLGGGIQWKK